MVLKRPTYQNFWVHRQTLRYRNQPDILYRISFLKDSITVNKVSCKCRSIVVNGLFVRYIDHIIMNTDGQRCNQKVKVSAVPYGVISFMQKEIKLLNRKLKSLLCGLIYIFYSSVTIQFYDPLITFNDCSSLLSKIVKVVTTINRNEFNYVSSK